MQTLEGKTLDPDVVWGLPGTILWGLVISLIYFYAQIFGLGIYIGLAHGTSDLAGLERLLEQYAFHGMALSYGLFAAALVCVPLVLGVIKLKRQSNLVSYLGLRAVGIGTFGYWSLALLALGFAFDLLLWFIGRPIVPDFSIEIYRSAEGAWVLWLAIVLVAPLVEEVFFRGFLFRGFAASILGPAGAITLTALIWAAFHLQYDALQMGFVFVVGILLGMARYVTGSIVLSFGLHALMNLGAMLLTAFTLAN